MLPLKTLKTAAAIVGLLTVTSFASAADLSAVPSGGYEVDPTHAYVNFQYNHLGLSNPTLGFDDFTVDLNLDNADPTKSTVSVTVTTDSVLTGSDAFKKHLTGGGWFNTSEFPTITFESTSVEAAGDGMYKVAGNATVKGITKPLSLDVTINAAMNHPMNGKPVIGLDATGSLLRSDFGLGKNAPYISDEVALSISVEMFKAE
ncbi:YceI family protein [Granulosicoccus sp.]|nr:YceI family protein [Granulosicoccus sp.]MDB4222871.1 YceI family protein [Granulosicoccus sp.]